MGILTVVKRNLAVVLILISFITKPATTHPSEPHAPGFAIFWCHEASLPTEHGGSVAGSWH
jgi:hypothetical protein